MMVSYPILDLLLEDSVGVGVGVGGENTFMLEDLVGVRMENTLFMEDPVGVAVKTIVLLEDPLGMRSETIVEKTTVLTEDSVGVVAETAIFLEDSAPVGAESVVLMEDPAGMRAVQVLLIVRLKMFRALSDQFYRTPEHHAFVRDQIVNQLKLQPEIYKGYVPMGYDDYIKKMSKSGEWGDHVTLQAAADSEMRGRFARLYSICVVKVPAAVVDVVLETLITCTATWCWNQTRVQEIRENFVGVLDKMVKSYIRWIKSYCESIAQEARG